MSDTLAFVFIIITVAGLMFFVPIMMISNNQEDIAQTAVQALVVEFVNKEATKGKVTIEDYNDFISKLYATGNTYEVKLKHGILTVNPNKGNTDKLGENLHYLVFNETIIDGTKGINNSPTGEYLMKKGDYFSCTVKNTNQTISKQFASAVYSIVGKDTYSIAAEESALVINTGSYSE